jgi:glutathione S-transferase
VESELGKNEWLVGKDLTAADVQLSFPIEAAAARGDTDKPRPNLKAFLARAHARPAYKRALEKGGPYELLR